MSAEELITQQLDLWTGAVTHKSGAGRGRSGKNGKIELTGIKKLRELILELAVRGKLVEQDPNDEPASVLLERIAEEKAWLVKEGKIKKQKNQIDVDPRQADFELPSHWSWTRLGSIGQVLGGGTPKSGEPAYWADRGVTWLTPADLYSLNEKHIETGKRDISELGLEKSSAQLLPKGSVLFSSRAPIGYVAIAAKELATNQGFKSCVPYICDTNQFIYYFLKRSSRLIDASASGTTFKEVSGAKVASIAMPLPPLAEQHRIVEKVDELMALCDRLEQQVGDQLEAHEVLVDTLLGALTRSTNAAETAENWGRIAEHFDTLFTTEASIDKLKQAVLQLAVMGKLVPQDPNDEPASVLLEKIAEEKARLVKEGRIKKRKLLASDDHDTPYEIPAGWHWEKLGNFTLVGTGSTPSRDRPDYYSPPEYAWVTSGETGQAYILDTKERISSLAVKETNITIYPAGTLIIAMYGQGKTRGQISELKVAAGTNQACAAVQSIIKNVSHKRYINLCFIKFYDEVREGAAGGAQPNLNTGKIANTLIPIPPLEEQHRIVAKVDELMALCDRLKDRLGKADDTRAHLAEAVVKQAVS